MNKPPKGKGENESLHLHVELESGAPMKGMPPQCVWENEGDILRGFRVGSAWKGGTVKIVREHFSDVSLIDDFLSFLKFNKIKKDPQKLKKIAMKGQRGLYFLKRDLGLPYF